MIQICAVDADGDERVLDTHPLPSFLAGDDADPSDISFFIAIVQCLNDLSISRRGGILSFDVEDSGFSDAYTPIFRENELALRLGSLVDNEILIPWEDILRSGSAWAAAQMICRRFLELPGFAKIDVADHDHDMGWGNRVSIRCGQELLQAKHPFYILVPHSFPPDFFLDFMESLMTSELRGPGISLYARFEWRWVGDHRCVYFRTEHSFRRLATRHGNREYFVPWDSPWVPWPDASQLTEDSDPHVCAQGILRALGVLK